MTETAAPPKVGAGRRRVRRTDGPIDLLSVDLREPVGTLVRLVAEGSRVREVSGAAEVEDAALHRPAVVVYDVTGPGAQAVYEALPDVPRIAIVPEGVSSAPEDEYVLREPFGAPALAAALAHASGRPLPARISGDPRRDPVVTRGFALGRVAAVAIAAVLELTVPPVGVARASLLALAFVYVGLRAWRSEMRSFLVSADALMAVAVVAGTGFVNSPYLPFSVVVAGVVGYRFGARLAVPGALLVGAGNMVASLPEFESGSEAVVATLASLALLPIAAGAGALGQRVRSTAGDDGQRLLVEMNQTLERLAGQAQILPGGLEVGTVAEQALLELREVLNISAGMVLVSQGELVRVWGGYGLGDPAPTSIRRDDAWWVQISDLRQPAELENLPASFLPTFNGAPLWVAPLLRGRVVIGAILIGLPGERGKDGRRVSRLLARLGEETALALDNARLFAVVRELSVDRERRRMARDLHDGVVQTLVHVGFELDLIGRASRHDAPEVAEEAQRLRKVIEGSVREVRNTISDLRSGRATEGLESALREHLRDLRIVDGPSLVLDSAEYAGLPSEVEVELFRIAQEAISNAIQHARASTIRVVLRTTDTGAGILAVEDDGHGFDAEYGPTDELRGVGLRSMHERVAIVGGRLTVDTTRGEGTRMTVEVRGERA